MNSAFDMTIEDLKAVQLALSLRQLDHRTTSRKKLRNCETIQLDNSSRSARRDSSTVDAQASDSAHGSVHPFPTNPLHGGGSKGTDQDEASTVGTYLPSPASSLGVPSKGYNQQVLPVSNQHQEAKREDAYSHILLPLASPIFREPLVPGTVSGSTKAAGFRYRSGRGRRSRWLATSTPHSSKPKFSRSSAIPETTVKQARTSFDRLPLLEKREYWAMAWDPIKFGHPTVMITFKYRRSEVRSAKAKRQTISELVYHDREAIRAFCRGCGFNCFPSMWVIETHNGVGCHIICQIPDHTGQREQLAHLLCRRRGVPIPAGKKAWLVATDDNSGCLVHFLNIDMTPFKRTGRTGFLGLVDYTSKELLKNQKRRDKKDLGKLAGCSQEINAAAIELFRSGIRLKPPVELVPACHPVGRLPSVS